MSTGQTRRDWDKKHIRNVVGCRVVKSDYFRLQGADNKGKIKVTPEDFLVSKSRLLPYTIYGTELKVHVPRSLCVRARVFVNITKGTIVSNQKSPTHLNKPVKSRYK